MADKTKQQEDGSRWIFLRALKDNVDYEKLTPTNQFVDKKSQEIILNRYKNPKKPNQKLDPAYNILLDKKVDELVEVFGGNLDKEWLVSYYYQTKALLTKYSKNNFKQLEIDRDSPGGFMEFISNLIVPLGVPKGGKDTWDPADVWIEDKFKEPKDPKKVLKEITSFGRNEKPDDRKLQILKMQQLNAKLRDFYRKEKIIGVSLKKAGKNAEYVDVNVGINEKEIAKEFDRLESLSCEIVGVKCALNVLPMKEVYGKDFQVKSEKMKKLFRAKKNDIYADNYPENPYCFATQETSIEIIDQQTDTTYMLTVKATQTSEYSNLKYEPTEKGKGSAKLGKAPVEMVATIISKYNLTFNNSNRDYPIIYDENKITEALTSIKSQSGKQQLTSSKIQFGITSESEFKENLKLCYACDPVTAQSKLMQLDFLKAILSLSRKDLSKLITDVVFVAKKEGRAFGPFGKIY
jgi:hypothetical protein